MRAPFKRKDHAILAGLEGIAFTLEPITTALEAATASFVMLAGESVIVLFPLVAVLLALDTVSAELVAGFSGLATIGAKHVAVRENLVVFFRKIGSRILFLIQAFGDFFRKATRFW